MITRDAFACAAMQAIISADTKDMTAHEISASAYEVADAMMKYKRKHPLRRASRSRKSVGFSTVA